MTRIDFYILSAQATDDRFALTCRIVEKALSQQHRLFIHSEHFSQAKQLNQLLWSFRGASFIPHGLLGKVEQKINPVLIGCGTDAGQEFDILINLDTKIPAFFNQFERLIVPIDYKNQDVGREHYRFFRDRGYNLKTYKLT